MASRHQGMMTGIDPSRYGPTWYAATAVAAPERPALTYDLDVDLCVMGAGLAGLTVAREVARRGWSVAVLEAGKVAGGASGRNGGGLAPGVSEAPRESGGGAGGAPCSKPARARAARLAATAGLCRRDLPSASMRSWSASGCRARRSS